MNILIVCNWGKNRSRYLADYLVSKGYNTKTGGLSDKTEPENRLTQESVDWADRIIVAHKDLEEKLLKNYNIGNKITVVLDVNDKTSDNVFKPNLDGDDWLDYQNKFVYPELQRQINKYLPL